MPIELEAALNRLYPDEDDAARRRRRDAEAPLGRRRRAAEGPRQRGAGHPAGQPADHPRGRDARLRHPYRAVRGPAARPLPLRRRAARGRQRRRARLAAAIISRIKIMARLDIAERRLPQDGRIKLAVRGQDVDFRVSTIPSLYGETRRAAHPRPHRRRVRLRAPRPVAGGDPPASAPALELPNGIVLVTGPTGSGKTTTLYTGLLALNAVTRKIVTVEDPIEYQLHGINQIQVHSPDRADLRQPAALDPAAGPRRDHGRRDPRPGDRADRGAGGADRASGAVDAAHQLGRRRDHPAARHGGGGLSADRRAARRPGAAAGAPAVPALPPRRAAPPETGPALRPRTALRRQADHAVPRRSAAPPAARPAIAAARRSPSSWSPAPRSNG